MKALIVGGGGREHALAWAIARSPRVDELYIAPGNGGTAPLGTNVPIAATDVDALLNYAREQAIDLTVVGPEAPLMDSIVDRFESAGMRCFGPARSGARLEGSKVFAKEFMRRHDVPTADFRVFDDAEAARSYVKDKTPPMVVKADGLAAGKGVYVVDSNQAAVAAVEEIMAEKKFGGAGDKIVVEECLEGDEISIHAIVSGGSALLLPSSQDHKRIFEGDQGPNTGGMGAYAPVPTYGEAERSIVYNSIIKPTLEGFRKDGIPFAGVLYAGLMWTSTGPMVLEFNVRFGDPETQVILPLIKSDLFELLYASADGKPLEGVEFWEDRTVATVVMAAGGYPGSYGKGHAIDGLEGLDGDNLVVFHAGTAREQSIVTTSGGRVLTVTAWDKNLRGALDAAYGGVKKIRFKDAYWRGDIGHRAL